MIIWLWAWKYIAAFILSESRSLGSLFLREPWDRILGPCMIHFIQSYFRLISRLGVKMWMYVFWFVKKLHTLTITVNHNFLIFFLNSVYQSSGPEPIHVWLPFEVVSWLPARQPDWDQRSSMHQSPPPCEQTHRPDQEQKVPLFRYIHTCTLVFGIGILSVVCQTCSQTLSQLILLFLSAPNSGLRCQWECVLVMAKTS